MRLSIVASIIAATFVLYLTLLSRFVYLEPTSGQQIVAGFRCTDQAHELLRAGQLTGDCPILPHAALESAGYRPEVVWTASSIRIVQLSIGLAWTILSAAIAYGTTMGFIAAAKAASRRKL